MNFKFFELHYYERDNSGTGISRLLVERFANHIVDDVLRVFYVIRHHHSWLVTVAIKLIGTDDFDDSGGQGADAAVFCFRIRIRYVLMRTVSGDGAASDSQKRHDDAGQCLSLFIKKLLAAARTCAAHGAQSRIANCSTLWICGPIECEISLADRS